MKFVRHHLISIVAMAAVIHAVIILYNSATGFIRIGGPAEFLFRLLFGTLVSAPVAVVIALIDERLARKLDGIVPWDRQFVLRIVTEAAAAAVTGAVLGIAVTLIAHSIAPYRTGLGSAVVTNMLITAVLNLIIISAVEAVIAVRRTREEKERAEQLERELSRIKFETLKMQLNPHFMFNSLNVLSSLLRKEPERAERFIGEFAAVYRYTLEVIDQPAVELSRELAFARSYLYLMDIRFHKCVQTEYAISSGHLHLFVPSLSIQTVLENVFKHNKVSEDAPLRITIGSEGDAVVITNDLRPKQRGEPSNGVGLENLRKRYALLGGRAPAFTMNGSVFTSVLPLLTPQ